MKRTKFCVNWSTFGREYSPWNNLGWALLTSEHHNFFLNWASKMSFLASSVHLSPKIIWANFWEELDRFSRRSSEKTVFHLLQYGGQTLFWKMTNETCQNQHNPGNKITSKIHVLDNIFKSYKRIFNDRNISRTLGGAVFILLWYLRDMILMIPTDFCDNMSNSQKIWKCMTNFKMADRGFNQSWYNWHLLIRHDTGNP